MPSKLRASHKAPCNSSAPREWFRDGFDDLYPALYQHRDRREALQFASRWPVWKVLPEQGWCLDLGCGSGRYASVIAERGWKVVGIDLSKTMLERAARDTRNVSNVYFLRADLRALPIKPYNSGCNRYSAQDGSDPLLKCSIPDVKTLRFSDFHLAVSLFTSFGYFDDDVEHLKMLKQVAALMQPGGVVVLDLPNIGDVMRHSTSDAGRRRQVGEYSIMESYHFDNERRRIEKYIEVRTDNQNRRYYESVRIWTSDELLRMTAAAGFTPVVPLWGSYSGEPLRGDSERMIYFGKYIG